MQRILFTLAISALLATPFTSVEAAKASVITIAQIKEMFADMRTKPGYKNWNIDGPLLWGYFFTDPDPKKLQPIADHLAKNGYRFVRIYPTDDRSTFFLHMERIEHHSPESLNQRNSELYGLAEQYKISSYDGMDVGPIK
jgi:hypothetical protein